MVRVGMNPYGIAYALGLQGAGTPRANPKPLTMHEYLDIVEKIGGSGVEIDASMLLRQDEPAFERMRDRIKQKRWWVVLARPLFAPDPQKAMERGRDLGARVMRLHLTPILCGDRNNCNWEEKVAEVRRQLREASELAEKYDLALAIEDHQDFCSTELMELCDDCGENIGICLDTANPLSVGEDPVEFARTVKPKLKHIHLKDYRVQFTDEGYRLVRCATGDGYVPFKQILAMYDEMEVTAGIEIGALNVRHIRLLTPGWWDLYPARTAAQLASALASARYRRLADDDGWTTPWEDGAAPEEIVAYELDQLRKSAENLRALGYLPSGREA